MANLFPLLRSIRPADINSTLYALAHALQGKGDQLGDTFEDLDAYLKRVNIKLPTLKTDLSLLADVAKTYDLAAPDLIRLLDNATVTARTITDKKDSLNLALGSITGLAKVTRVTLSENEQLLIDQVRYGRSDQAQVAMAALRASTGAEIPVGDRDGWLAWWQQRR